MLIKIIITLYIQLTKTKQHETFRVIIIVIIAALVCGEYRYATAATAKTDINGSGARWKPVSAQNELYEKCNCHY